MSTHVVEDPTGRTWRVGVPLLPWRPRWRGPRPWQAWSGAAGGRDATPDRRRRSPRYEVGDVAGEAVGQGVIELPLRLALESIGEGIAPALLAALAAVAVAVVLFGGLLLAVELLVAVLVSLAAVALRVVLRRPWMVIAVTDDDRMAWPVPGLRAARAHAAAVAEALAQGRPPPPVTVR